MRQAEAADFKRLAQDALGYGRQFVSANNGIKESSLHTLSALIGYFPDELDDLLVKELDQFGKKRGDVAHNSWLRNTRTFDSAEIEKSRIEKILELTKAQFESVAPSPPKNVSWFVSVKNFIRSTKFRSRF